MWSRIRPRLDRSGCRVGIHPKRTRSDCRAQLGVSLVPFRGPLTACPRMFQVVPVSLSTKVSPAGRKVSMRPFTTASKTPVAPISSAAPMRSPPSAVRENFAVGHSVQAEVGFPHSGGNSSRGQSPCEVGVRLYQGYAEGICFFPLNAPLLRRLLGGRPALGRNLGARRPQGV